MHPRPEWKQARNRRSGSTKFERSSTRLDAETLETKEGLRASQRDHRDVITLLEQRVAKLEDTVVKSQHTLRQQILDQAKSFLDELRGLRSELNETLERELGLLEVDYGEEQPRGRRQADERAAS